MIIAVDFDGTCVTHDYPEVGKDIGAVPVLKELVACGHQLILHTMRSGEQLQHAVDWFAQNGIVLYGIQKNPTQHEWTESNKCYAQLYLDDAALGCPLIFGKHKRPYVDWEEVLFTFVRMGVIPFNDANCLDLLKIKVKSDLLTISIGKKALSFAAENHPDRFIVNNEDDLIKKVADYLNDEDSEDGLTPIQRLIDKALYDLSEDGECIGVLLGIKKKEMKLLGEVECTMEVEGCRSVLFNNGALVIKYNDETTQSYPIPDNYIVGVFSETMEAKNTFSLEEHKAQYGIFKLLKTREDILRETVTVVSITGVNSHTVSQGNGSFKRFTLYR